MSLKGTRKHMPTTPISYKIQFTRDFRMCNSPNRIWPDQGNWCRRETTDAIGIVGCFPRRCCRVKLPSKRSPKAINHRWISLQSHLPLESFKKYARDPRSFNGKRGLFSTMDASISNSYGDFKRTSPLDQHESTQCQASPRGLDGPYRGAHLLINPVAKSRSRLKKHLHGKAKTH